MLFSQIWNFWKCQEYQDLEKNKSDILRFAHDRKFGKVEFVEEKESGCVNWKKRKIAGVVNFLFKNSNIIVSEISRLGCSMLECMETLSIAMKKRININTVKGNWQLDHSIQTGISSHW